jgi:hypothetical protein
MSKYTEWVKTLPCCHCKAPSDDPHHIIAIGMGIMGRKNHDITAMPLCRVCHAHVHEDPKSYQQTRWMIETHIQAINEGKIKL